MPESSHFLLSLVNINRNKLENNPTKMKNSFYFFFLIGTLILIIYSQGKDFYFLALIYFHQ